MMSPEALWNRYSAIWSLEEDARPAELADCLADDFIYCDPNGRVEGRTALSTYMGGFRKNVPGGKFQIRTVLHHHDRTLAHWTLYGPNDAPLQNGISFGLLADDGRLRSITGFPHQEEKSQQA